MALIKCPNCGEDISEKAFQCIHCGFQLREEEKVVEICQECGTELEDGAGVCPNCGCPVERGGRERVQQVEVTSVKIPLSKRKKGMIISLAILAFVLVAGSVAGVMIKKNIDEKKAEKAKAKYIADIKTARTTMLAGASLAEYAGGLIHDVWYNAIYEKSDETTNKYTQKDDSWYDYYDETEYYDFNTALQNLQEDSEFKKKISSIRQNQKTVQSMMKELQNPPEEHKEAYDALKEFYAAYTELVGCATNPTGNLTSYTSSYNEADQNTSNCYKAMEMYLED